MRNKWTTEQLEWLESNASRDRHDLIKKFNKTFNANITMTALKTTIHRFNLKLPSPRVRWTKDKLEWLESQSFNDKRDLLKAFNEKYNANIKVDHLTHIAYLYNIHIPDKQRIYKPQGSIMYSKHNIPQVKIKDRVYMSMHRYLYEMYHDVTLNDNDMIVFLDGNKNNFDKKNLYKITQNINGIMHSNKLHHVKTDKLTVIKFCEWKEILTTLKKHQRKEQNQNYV
jgi:hypothetical protein